MWTPQAIHPEGRLPRLHAAGSVLCPQPDDPSIEGAQLFRDVLEERGEVDSVVALLMRSAHGGPLVGACLVAHGLPPASASSSRRRRAYSAATTARGRRSPRSHLQTALVVTPSA